MIIAIITWCTYTNLGTYLQAYALQRYLKDKDYEVHLLDDSRIIPVSHSIRDRIKSSLKKFIIFLKRPSYRLLFKEDKESSKLYKSFREKYLDIDKDIFPLDKLDNKYDLYICGSDQIWNPGGFETDKNKGYYFANFTTKKKIAYAPSIGVSRIPEEYELHYIHLLKGFSHLSAREEDGVKELSRISNKEVANVVDPTILLSKEQWINLIVHSGYENNMECSDYIILYLLTYNEDYVRFAESYAKRKNRELRIIHSICVDFKGKNTEAAGPIQFLSLIRNASYVMTDSFHGTIFSLIFEKQFITFKRFKDNDKKGQNSRIVNLLGKVNLQNRLLDENQLTTFHKFGKVDYTMVNKELNTLIQYSKDYLDNAILS